MKIEAKGEVMELWKKLVIILFSLALVACSTYAQKCFWWTVSSSGDVWTESDSINGFTVGQVSAGPVADEDSSLIANYGFWNDFLHDLTLCFDIRTSYGDTLTWWNAGTLSYAETRTMSISDSIVITNCGDCHVNFGLAVDSVYPGEWSPNFWVDNDRFVLRGSFTDEADVPISFDRVEDYLKISNTWATPEKFGPEGHDMGLNEQYYLWFQLMMPTGSSATFEIDTLPGDTLWTIRVESTIRVGITGRSYLP